jgi:rod shape determining protein RodA
MRKQNEKIFQGVDRIIILLYLVLILLGLGNIYAAVYNEDHRNIFDFTQRYGKQVLWIAGAFLLALIIIIIDAEFFVAFAFPIYAVSIIMLVVVLFFGTEVSGSKSWLKFGDFGVQPAEFAKFAVNLALAKYLSRMDIKMKSMKTKIISSLLIIIPILLILLEDETGVAIVFFSFVFVLYREGLSGNFLLLGLLVALLFIFGLLFNSSTLLIILGSISLISLLFIRRKFKNILLIAGAFLVSVTIVYGTHFVFEKLPQHQKTRINVFLGKELSKDAKKGVYYNVNQAMIAIGSGGLTGKGYLEGTQTKFDFVPEQDTDFIFCTVGEEWGFIGSSSVIILFIILIIRIVFISERQRTPFGRIYGYGVAAILFFHLVVNVGMTIGLAPVIGIPLPFFSYGGSSLWAFTILLFIFLKLDAQRLQILR